jgi:hypothetical protein
MRKLILAVAVLVPLAVATRPSSGGTASAASQTPSQSWCDANVGRPIFGAVLCAAVAEEVQLYVRGLPFEIVAVGADFVTLRPELSGERRRLLTIPFTAIRRLERTGRPREMILDQ